jgi:hypothetical protein
MKAATKADEALCVGKLVCVSTIQINLEERQMKLRVLAAGVMTGLAAAAIAAAPMASAANPSTTTDTGRATITDKKGHNAVVVKPPSVSAPNSYGNFSSPVPFMFFD